MLSARMTAPRIADNEWINFKIVADVSSIEVFFDDGITAMTAISFQEEEFSKLKIFGVNGVSTDSVRVKPLKGIW